MGVRARRVHAHARVCMLTSPPLSSSSSFHFSQSHLRVPILAPASIPDSEAALVHLIKTKKSAKKMRIVASSFRRAARF